MMHKSIFCPQEMLCIIFKVNDHLFSLFLRMTAMIASHLNICFQASMSYHSKLCKQPGHNHLNLFYDTHLPRQLFLLCGNWPLSFRLHMEKWLKTNKTLETDSHIIHLYLTARLQRQMQLSPLSIQCGSAICLCCISLNYSSPLTFSSLPKHWLLKANCNPVFD